MYFSPMHLRDMASGNLTDFTTNFTFVIDSQGKSNYGDGLSFFLAPNGSITPPNVGEGGPMGLTNNYEPFFFFVTNIALNTREHTTLQGGKNISGGPMPLQKEDGEGRGGKVGMQPE
jgi:hypothetical protein